MKKTRIIIICGGRGTRWKKHMGIEKHFADIDGWPLIARTVNQLSTMNVDIFIVAREKDMKLYKTQFYAAKINYVTPDNAPSLFDANKFYSSRKHWNNDGRTILLYGDVFFTGDAIETIFKYQGSEPKLFARPFDSKFTGKPYGECFAYSFDQHGIRKFEAAILRSANLYASGLIERCGGWEIYRALSNFPDAVMNRHVVTDNIGIIDDFTDDFDSPEEYEKFISNYNSFYKKNNEK